MSKEKTLMFVGAHPDDETFGIGSTLAQYAASGVKVYYICAARGEVGTIHPKLMKGFASIAEKRCMEMKCAAQVLGLADVIYLGYRDSGMPGSEDNQHPNSLVKASPDEVAGRIVKVIRELKPDVVITHDSGGGYGHPDHVAVHKATVNAFYAANDPLQYPQAGPAFQPSKLYFAVRSYRIMRMLTRLMPLMGQDPHHFGRNKDIDLTKVARVEYPIHAVIRLKRESIKTRERAAACHASQGGAQPRRGLFKIIGIIEKLRGIRDYFMLGLPPAPENNKQMNGS